MVSDEGALAVISHPDKDDEEVIADYYAAVEKYELASVSSDEFGEMEVPEHILEPGRVLVWISKTSVGMTVWAMGATHFMFLGAILYPQE